MRSAPSACAILSTLLLCASANLPPQITFHHDLLESIVPARMSTLPNLDSVLTTQPRGSMFFDYVRDFASVSSLLVAASNTTIFVPTNQAITSMSRRPHEDILGANQLHSAQEREEDSKSRLEEFVRMHIVPRAIDLASDGRLQTMLPGRTIEVKGYRSAKDGSVQISRWMFSGVVSDGKTDVNILDVVEASNGRIIFIDGTFSV